MTYFNPWFHQQAHSLPVHSGNKDSHLATRQHSAPNSFIPVLKYFPFHHVHTKLQGTSHNVHTLEQIIRFGLAENRQWLSYLAAPYFRPVLFSILDLSFIPFHSVPFSENDSHYWNHLTFMDPVQRQFGSQTLPSGRGDKGERKEGSHHAH